MNKHNQYGFGIVGIIAIIITVIIIGALTFVFISSMGNQTNTVAPSDISEKKDDLVLVNVGLASLDSILISEDALREYETMGLKGFYAFGEILGNTGRINPNFEFASLKPGTLVIASIDGIVVSIKEQAGSDDNEVFLQPFDGSAWVVGYDHLSRITVKQGDTVKAGDVLGEPVLQGNGLPRFELQVNKKADNTELSYCPSALLDPSVKDEITSSLSSMMQQWETISGYDLYDVSAQQPAGCLVDTVKP